MFEEDRICGISNAEACIHFQRLKFLYSFSEVCLDSGRTALDHCNKPLIDHVSHLPQNDWALVFALLCPAWYPAGRTTLQPDDAECQWRCFPEFQIVFIDHRVDTGEWWRNLRLLILLTHAILCSTQSHYWDALSSTHHIFPIRLSKKMSMVDVTVSQAKWSSFSPSPDNSDDLCCPFENLKPLPVLSAVRAVCWCQLLSSLKNTLSVCHPFFMLFRSPLHTSPVWQSRK